MKQEPTLAEARRKAAGFGMYVIEHLEQRRGGKEPVLMYRLYRRLRFANHGAYLGKRNSVAGLMKLIDLAKEVK